MSKKKRPYCLTIAGFDPSGGAGVLADIKVFEQHRVQGFAVITSNTVQTEDEFVACNWIALTAVIEQTTLLFKRYPIDFVKIGLIENAESLLTIVKLLRDLNPTVTIVWDPVLKPTAGGDFDIVRFNAILPELLENIQYITPNLIEAQLLFLEERLEVISSRFKVNIYLKGGHSTDNKGRDLLYTPEQTYPFKSHITGNWDKHGTGCVLSSALLAHFALDYPLVKSCLKSKRYIEMVLTSNSSRLGYHKR